MLILRGNTDVLKVITGSAGDIRPFADVMFADAGTPPVVQPLPDFQALTAITGAATNTLIDASAIGAGKVYNVKTLSLYNASASVTNAITVEVTDGTNTTILWAGTLLPLESVIRDESGNWTALTSGGIPKLSNFVGPVDIQTFSVNGTWTKPTSFTPKAVFVKVWGAGGGGGAGASLATAVVAKGGAGGGAGAFARDTFLATDLGATVAVTVGTGGTAGSPGAAGALGGDGGIGGNSSFGTTLVACGGGGGRGGAVSAVASGGGGGGGTGTAGTTGSTTVGLGGSPLTQVNTTITGVAAGQGSAGTVTVVTTHCAEYGGGGGGGSTSTPTSSVGGSSIFGGGGGGTGGHHNATPAIVAWCCWWGI